jgi:hypothetical protein
VAESAVMVKSAVVVKSVVVESAVVIKSVVVKSAVVVKSVVVEMCVNVQPWSKCTGMLVVKVVRQTVRLVHQAYAWTGEEGTHGRDYCGQKRSDPIMICVWCDPDPSLIRVLSKADPQGRSESDQSPI